MATLVIISHSEQIANGTKALLQKWHQMLKSLLTVV